MYEIILPFAPTVNHYKKRGAMRYTKNGKTFQSLVNTDETKRFYYEVWMRCRVLMAEKRILKPIEATISVEIDLHAPDRRKRDIDNTIKPTLDALQKAGLILDDNQIACLLVTRKVIMAQGQIIVRIKPYDCISGPS